MRQPQKTLKLRKDSYPDEAKEEVKLKVRILFIIVTLIFLFGCASYYAYSGRDKASQFYYTRALEKYRARDYAGAIADYTVVIKQNGNDGGAYFGRGAAKQQGSDCTGAISDFNEAIRINSGNADAFFMRGLCKFLLGDFAGAKEDYNNALNFVSGNYNVTRYDIEEAVKLLESAEKKLSP
ncbi:MAG: hypothetical protein HY761_08650 [Candidatus Omnitrophica bacterium]|nr:hypothetical protein [Candidatus Omnitrophota bacterium]